MSFFSRSEKAQPAQDRITGLLETEQRWIDDIMEEVSRLSETCFVRFEFHPEKQGVSCYRETQGNPLGKTIENISPSDWTRLSNFLFDHTPRLPDIVQDGEEKREFIVWTSPRHTWDRYVLTPNTVTIKYIVKSKTGSIDNVPWCGLDGPCTAH